jgi:transcriptional regulator with XRE-family HTH domain
MKNTSTTVIMAPEVGTKALHSSSDEMAWETVPIPTSALKESRGNRSQVEIAQAAGISQGFLSALESGRKRLTPGVAQKLAPALGTTADRLVFIECLANLNRVAQKGHISLRPLLAEAERLAGMLPGGEVGDAIIDALVRIVRERQKVPN